MGNSVGRRSRLNFSSEVGVLKIGHATFQARLLQKSLEVGTGKRGDSEKGPFTGESLKSLEKTPFSEPDEGFLKAF